LLCRRLSISFFFDDQQITFATNLHDAPANDCLYFVSTVFCLSLCRYIDYLSSLAPLTYGPAAVDAADSRGRGSSSSSGAIARGNDNTEVGRKEPSSSLSSFAPSSLEELEDQMRHESVQKGEDARLSKRERIAAAAARAHHRGWAIPEDDL